MKLTTTFLKVVLSLAKAAKPAELDCGECWEKVDRFAELTLSGKNAAEAMPLVQYHMDICPECKDEFEALLVAMQAIRWTAGDTGMVAGRVVG